ncbi:hypothetical protein [Bifidobacterium mongoliense]|uniref:Uncharacterized protein n=1 Tax=Bifidobacterium mongoliense DSM 21395 TaxID=1437603 RepID=A0A087CA70_9BIFI|nr:hypothetical protein [Bifidobacterium mongoliense]KFI80170.1 hypothetical protein BMON_0038 [Bifidobacterium mongoliense DSM 21395]
MSGGALAQGDEHGSAGSRHPVRRALMIGIVAYVCVWLGCFCLLREAQQGWGLLYSDHLNAIETAAQVSTLPADLFARGKVEPWPKGKVVPMNSTPPDSVSPCIWDLISFRRQVIDQKQRVADDIDAQTSYTAQTFAGLKKRES